MKDIWLATEKDFDFIRYVEEKTKDTISDDEGGKIDLDLIKIPCVYFLVCEIGFFIFHAQNNQMVQGHFAFIKNGKIAKDYTEKAIKWIFSNTKYVKIIGLIPDFNKKAKIMAALLMNREGKIKKAFLKNGQLMDLIVYGKDK